MVSRNLKEETFRLMDKREAISIEMNVIIQRLSQPGGPGISGNLVDSEGFPRTDIDIPTIRADRQRLAELQNDYKDITKKIEENIQIVHSATVARRPSSATDSGNDKGSDCKEPVTFSNGWSTSTQSTLIDTSSVMDIDMVIRLPFAIIDEITEASPAAEDGLQLGDQITKFGDVEFGDNILTRLASEVQAKQGSAIPIVVMRQGAVVNLAVTPRTWRGRGLLGCHFRNL